MTHGQYFNYDIVLDERTRNETEQLFCPKSRLVDGRVRTSSLGNSREGTGKAPLERAREHMYQAWWAVKSQLLKPALRGQP